MWSWLFWGAFCSSQRVQLSPVWPLNRSCQCDPCHQLSRQYRVSNIKKNQDLNQVHIQKSVADKNSPQTSQSISFHGNILSWLSTGGRNTMGGSFRLRPAISLLRALVGPDPVNSTQSSWLAFTVFLMMSLFIYIYNFLIEKNYFVI